LPEGKSVLITRPEPAASETAARVAALGFQPVIAPLLTIKIQRLRMSPPEDLQAVLVTSGNALAALPASHRDLPLLAVGDATASRARAAGFTNVSTAHGDAKALAALAIRSCHPFGLPLLLAAGKGHGSELAAILKTRGFKLQWRVAYTSVLGKKLPQAARNAIAAGTLGAALFYSAETARTFVRLVQRAELAASVRSVDALAIGQPAAVALQALPWRRIRVAARPNQDAMLALLR